jgi:hypothetical protein
MVLHIKHTVGIVLSRVNSLIFNLIFTLDPPTQNYPQSNPCYQADPRSSKFLKKELISICEDSVGFVSFSLHFVSGLIY